MKKIFIIIPLVIIGSVVVLIYLIAYLRNLPASPPERVGNIPLTAVWRGGQDGGMWFDVVKVKNDSIFNIRVYMDIDGRIVEDGDFVANKEAMDEISKVKDVRDLITAYFNNIYIRTSNNKVLGLKKIRSYK